jgi:ureidoglycolate lyase
LLEIVPQPLTKEAFAPFGDVIDMPTAAGRFYHDAALGNLNARAAASLSVALKAETTARPFVSQEMERHEYSSQTFIPVDVGRWLIVVAPHAAAGGPDMAAARAFIADGTTGVTYKANTWHHGLTTLDRPGSFAVFMWKAGTVEDEEFVPVAPFTIPLP